MRTNSRHDVLHQSSCIRKIVPFAITFSNKFEEHFMYAVLSRAILH